jgi:hypothetical protein
MAMKSREMQRGAETAGGGGLNVQKETFCTGKKEDKVGFNE